MTREVDVDQFSLLQNHLFSSCIFLINNIFNLSVCSFGYFEATTVNKIAHCKGFTVMILLLFLLLCMKESKVKKKLNGTFPEQFQFGWKETQ